MIIKKYIDINKKKQNIRSFSNEGFIPIRVKCNNKEVMIPRTVDWQINITAVCKLLGKRWRDWKKWNQNVINAFELLEGKCMVNSLGPANKKQTFLPMILALRVLSDFDVVLCYQIFKTYESQLLNNSSEKLVLGLEVYRKKLEIAEAHIAKLSNKPLKIDLVGGKFLLYGYFCNKKVKFGTSYCNKNGQRPKSHKTSVPDLSIGFVVYSSRSNLQKLNVVIKEKFKIKGEGNLEHISTKLVTLQNFVFGYLDLMGWDYKKEDIHTLTLLNIFLKN